MSESSAEPSAPSGSGLYDESGRPLRSRQSNQTSEDLVRFAREYPVTTALMALALGYVLGKLF